METSFRICLGSAQVYPEYDQSEFLLFGKFTILLSIVPDLCLWTPFVGGIGFNLVKAVCLLREGEKEGHLGIINSRVCGLQLSTLGPNVRHWSGVFSVWSKKAVSSPLRGLQAGLLWGLGLLGILINSLVRLMDYQAVSWQSGLGGGGYRLLPINLPVASLLSASVAPGPATERWLHFLHPADGSNRLAQSFRKSSRERRAEDWPSGAGTKCEQENERK